MRVGAFRLKHDLVPFLVPKLHDFVFDRWAIARANPLDLATVQR